jgi:hypothetical protein
MKRKAFETHRDRCRALFDAWMTRLGLKWYAVEVRYYDKRKAYRAATGASPNGAMIVTTDWKYMRATVSVCVPAVRGLDDDELERAVVHELCHVLVAEMRGVDEPRTAEQMAHEERVVSMLTKAFMWVKDGV